MRRPRTYARTRERADLGGEQRAPSLLLAIVLTWIACGMVVSIVSMLAAISAVVMGP